MNSIAKNDKQRVKTYKKDKPKHEKTLLSDSEMFKIDKTGKLKFWEKN